MTNTQPKHQNGLSTSNASVSSKKRKEYHRQYYASRKENNKLSTFGAGDVTQSDSLISSLSSNSIERMPLRSLPTNGSQTQTRNHDITATTTHPSMHCTNDVSTSNASTSVEKRKERNRRYYISTKEKNKVSNAATDDDCTPTTVVTSVINEVMPKRSRGFLFI